VLGSYGQEGEGACVLVGHSMGSQANDPSCGSFELQYTTLIAQNIHVDATAVIS